MGAVAAILQHPQTLDFSAAEIGFLSSCYLTGAVIGALVQLSRGQIAPPAATLLWDAGEMLRVWRTTLDEQNEAAPESAAAEG